MTEVENLIYQFDNSQKEIMLFLHHMLTNEYLLTDKITFKNPCYYKNSWICYLKPIKNEAIELAFMRGNELSNHQGILKSNGRKQLMSIEISEVKEMELDIIKEILNEAIYLDETKPYASKRK
ncbi:hypothetical protein GTQ40_17350 [Flavobacteriaceae bacterium R38]|nr:hypothetical protein [Flavobacteriaceae bacterium R38]